MGSTVTAITANLWSLGRRAVPGIAIVALVVLSSLAAVALLLSEAQKDSRDAVMSRFAERAQISAALTQSVFSAVGTASSEQLIRRYSGSPAELARSLPSQLTRSRSRYLAVIDARGRTLASAGPVPRRVKLDRAAVGGPVLSNVLPYGEGLFVEYAIPFGPRNARRAVVQAMPLKTLASFLDEYLARLHSLDDAGLALTDRNGVVLTVLGDVSLGGKSRPTRIGTVATVPGTPWALRLEAARDRILGGVDRLRWLPWVLVVALAIASMAGLALYSRARNSVRRQREANVALQESRDQIRTLVGALEEGVLLHHADGSTELLNASAQELLGARLEAARSGAPGWALFDEAGNPLESTDAPVLQALATGLPQAQIVGMQPPDGARQWLSVRARPLTRPGDASPHAVVASCTDVTEQRELELHLIELAQRDSLTGLWNRRRFEDDLAKQIARCRRYGEVAALLVLDLDGFKEVNDTLGHLAGDEVLRALADGLSQRLRASDSAARIGGDEFALLLPNVSDGEARAVAADVAERLSDFVHQHLDCDVHLSLSIGVTLLNDSVAGVSEAFTAADRAMYEDKRRAGRVSTVASEVSLGKSSVPRPSSLHLLLTVVQARDSYTATHSREVVTLARAVARRLGLDDAAVREVENTALLHDLGKIALPDAVLRKTGPLTAHERVLMRQHPIVGAQIVSSIPELEHLAPAVRAEHERWDGAGYPDGLAGEAIPLSSRIAFVCDSYHAMTSDRPYRRALSREAAMEEIARESGSQFCPTAAQALLEILRADVVGRRLATNGRVDAISI